jgi:hypothetical protein
MEAGHDLLHLEARQRSSSSDKLQAYHPSSMPWKIMEHLVLCCLEHFLGSNLLLPQMQFGFRQGCSTINALHLLKNKNSKVHEAVRVLYCGVPLPSGSI